jgi:hypothetical protein
MYQGRICESLLAIIISSKCIWSQYRKLWRWKATGLEAMISISYHSGCSKTPHHAMDDAAV